MPGFKGSNRLRVSNTVGHRQRFRCAVVLVAGFLGASCSDTPLFDEPVVETPVESAAGLEIAAGFTSQSQQVGDTVRVESRIEMVSGGPGTLAGLVADLTFDAQALRFLRAESGDAEFAYAIPSGAGTLLVLGVSPEGFSGANPVTLAFEVLSADYGMTNLGLELREAATTGGTLIAPSGSVQSPNFAELAAATCRLKHDVNEDGLVNIFDIIYVVKSLRSERQGGLADIDRSGTVNIFDIIKTVNALKEQSGECLEYPVLSYLNEESGIGRAIVLKYESIWDVHPEPVPGVPLDQQEKRSFDNLRILSDLSGFREAGQYGLGELGGYDFVLLMSGDEVPGWIFYGGDRGVGIFEFPAKNIGRRNTCVEFPSACDLVAPDGWTSLRAALHANAVHEIVEEPTTPTTPLMHEMGHHWLAYAFMNSSSIGCYSNVNTVPDAELWDGTIHPVAYLLGSNSLRNAQHWFNCKWTDPDDNIRYESWPEAGMMLSGGSSRFNAFDLYFMGLMGYDEVSSHEYEIDEYPFTLNHNTHRIDIDDLIDARRLEPDNYFEADGRRIPDTEPAAESLQSLIIVVTGYDQTFDEDEGDAVVDLARQLESDWAVATWDRSQLSSVVW